jgi:hypothetical protein
MFRNIGAIVAGIAAWIVIATILDRLLRLAWPEYAAALPALAFTLPMMFARLCEGAIATIAAGLFGRWLARTPLWTSAVQGFVIVLFFLPVHYHLWHNFPVWYHFVFLGYLVPLTMLGAASAPARAPWTFGRA